MSVQCCDLLLFRQMGLEVLALCVAASQLALLAGVIGKSIRDRLKETAEEEKEE